MSSPVERTLGQVADCESKAGLAEQETEDSKLAVTPAGIAVVGGTLSLT